MDSNNGIRVGIVGCGNQGKTMARAIARTNVMQVTACADPDQGAAEQLAAMAGHPAIYASVHEMLREDDVDAVIIATPHNVLGDVSLAAIHAGKHVLVEKPCGMDEKELVQIEAAVVERGVCYMAGYSFRSFVALQQVHELLQAGAVGEIQMIVGSIGTRSMTSGWRAYPATGGGPLLYIGSHLIDEILWYLNDAPVEVYASMSHRTDTQADETTSFQIRFAKGAVAQGFTTQTSEGFFNNLDIHGKNGRVSLRGAGFLAYTIEVVSNTLSAYAHPTTIHPRLNDDSVMLMHMPQLKEFAGAIHDQRQPAVTVADARRVLRITDAIFQSGQAGKAIQFEEASLPSMIPNHRP